MTVEYKEVPDYPGYMVGDDGGVIGKAGRPLTPYADDRGRKRYTLSRDGLVKKYAAAHLVLLAFVGPCPDGMECCHNDGDCTNNRLLNLRWDTHSANMLDKRRHGTSPQGERGAKAKLLSSDIVAIRARRLRGERLAAIASDYGVTEANICAIAKRKTWSHV